MAMPSLRNLLPLSVLATLLVCAPSAHAYARLDLGIHDPSAEAGDTASFDRASELSPSISRRPVYWAQHVPGGPTKPAGFDTRDPADPHYDWTKIDAFVRAAHARGIEPLITTLSAPAWAEGDDAADRAQRVGDPGTYRVNAREFGAFMTALATRYSGTFPDPLHPGRALPRVRYFQMWNEQNFGLYLMSRRKSEIPEVYVRLLNAGYNAVKRVSRSNLVITGGLGPFGNNGRAVDVQPQAFMRAMLCLAGVGGKHLRERSRCRTPMPKFDVWAQHPYTFAGTPTSRGAADDAAALGNMIDVRRTLEFAVRKRNVAPARDKRLWATEFGWFSNPPGALSGAGAQLGLPLTRQASYLSESAYRLWRQGFSALVWYGLHDLTGFPTGLVHGASPTGKAKPAFNALRFPFYADARGEKILIWGVASGSGRSSIAVEKKSGRRWKRLGYVRSDSRGMVYRRTSGRRGTYRIKVVRGDRRGLISEPFKAR